MADVFRTPILSRYGVLIHGGNETTGFGKSMCALRIACQYAIAYNQESGAPRDEAVVVRTSTLEALKGLQMKRGWIVVLDEFHPFDREQVIHLSEHGLKVLMDRAAGGALRGRNSDIVFPPCVPLICTANVDSGEAWCGGRFLWSLPLQRKTVVFHVDRPLCVPNWASSSADTADDMPEVFEVMAGSLPPSPAPAENLVGMLRRNVREMFGF